MKFYKNILWDFNGTIIDDAELCLDSYNHVLVQYDKMPINREELSEKWSLPVKDFFAKFNFEAIDLVINELCEKFHDFYSVRWPKCQLQPEVSEFIISNHNNKICQAVLSGHPHNYLIEMLEHFELNNYFNAIKGVDTIVAVDKIQTGKDLMKELNLSANETILIGDANFDVETAKALGIDCALIARGIQSFERLKALDVPVFSDLQTLRNNLFL